jgi:hypothetical protein
MSTMAWQRAQRNRRPGAASGSASPRHGRRPQRVEYCPGMRARHVWGTASVWTWPFRATPCLPLPIWQVVTAPLCARYTPQRCDRAPGTRGPVDMWTTQGRCPQIHRPSKQQSAPICLLGNGRASDPGPQPAGDCQPGRSPDVTGDCTIFARIPTAVHTARATTEWQVGVCRHFTLLHVAMLRTQGIPARARCGFGAYFEGVNTSTNG